MDINLNSTSINAYKQNESINTNVQIVNSEQKEASLEQTINESAVSVNISMNAQVVLFSMNTSDLSKNNSLLQGLLGDENKDVFNFLSANGSLDGLNLQDIGYTGKPITELNSQEASDLLSENGFFGINQTSQRVSDFVFSFAGDDLELLEKGRDGIIKGFEEAEKLFGGELPEISYKTQERTLSLIDEKINSLKASKEEENVE